MKKTLTIAIFAFSLFGLKAQTFNPNLAAKLQQVLDIGITSNASNKGYSASVYYPEQGIWKGVAGISHTGTPITSDMEFALASNSKVFTAVAIMKLVEANILNLDDSLQTWLPNFPNINSNITIRQLLNHTSGIADMYSTNAQIDLVWNDLSRVWTPEEVLTWIGSPVHNSPGSAFSYSNTNYILLGMIVKSATNIHVSQYIRNNILTPLQLDSIFYSVSEPNVGVIAHPWTNKNATTTLPSVIDVSNVSQNSFLSAAGPAGCMYSTASEMAQFYKALFNGQILNNNSIAQMTTFNLAISNYGLGIEKFTFNTRTVWGHGGNIYFGRTRTMYDTCSKAIIIGLSNSNPSGIDGTTALLHKVLVDYLPACPNLVNGLTTVCQGQTSVIYTVPLITNATSYIWTLPNGVTGVSNTNTITVNYGANAVSGNISVVGSNIYGESPATILQIIVNPLPATPVISINGNTLTSNAPSGNQWYNSSGVIVGATNTTYTINSSDNYYCIVTLLGCSSDTSNNIDTVLSNIDETFLQNNLKIYPNPSSSDITFQANFRFNNATLLLNDCSGRTVTKINNISDYSFILHRNNLVNGLYFVQLIEDNRVIAIKKIVLTD